jgi:hypothetical protein
MKLPGIRSVPCPTHTSPSSIKPAPTTPFSHLTRDLLAKTYGQELRTVEDEDVSRAERRGLGRSAVACLLVGLYAEG